MGSSCCCPLCLGEDDANEPHAHLSQTEWRAPSGGRSPGVVRHKGVTSLRARDASSASEAGPVQGSWERCGAWRVHCCVASLGFRVTVLSRRGTSAWGGQRGVQAELGPGLSFRSDFVTLPFQGAEVLLDSVMPLSGNRWGLGLGLGLGRGEPVFSVGPCPHLPGLSSTACDHFVSNGLVWVEAREHAFLTSSPVVLVPGPQTPAFRPTALASTQACSFERLPRDTSLFLDIPRLSPVLPASHPGCVLVLDVYDLTMLSAHPARLESLPKVDCVANFLGLNGTCLTVAVG